MQKQLTTHIAFASFIGTAIEFYDFYIYAMAEALMTGQVFFSASDPATQSLNTFLSLALFLMGATFAPMDAYLPEQFPVAVGYTGAGLAYQLGGILGASIAPYISQLLVSAGGLAWGWVLMFQSLMP